MKLISGGTEIVKCACEKLQHSVLNTLIEILSFWVDQSILVTFQYPKNCKLLVNFNYFSDINAGICERQQMVDEPNWNFKILMLPICTNKPSVQC